MKKAATVLFLTAVMALGVTGLLSAADPTTALTPEQREQARENIIQQRTDMQAQRIENGVVKGRLTDAELARLQSQLDKIRQDFATMKTNETTGLTKREFNQLQRELNKNSERIHRLKHNQRNHEKVVKQP